MKLLIYKDEYYPFYGLTESTLGAMERDVSPERALWVKEGMKRFEEIQDFLAEVTRDRG